MYQGTVIGQYTVMKVRLATCETRGPAMIPSLKLSQPQNDSIPKMTHPQNDPKVNLGMVWHSSIDTHFHCNDYILAKAKKQFNKNFSLVVLLTFS